LNLALRDPAGLSARRTAQRKTGWLSKQAKAAIRFARQRPWGLCVQFMHGVKIFRLATIFLRTNRTQSQRPKAINKGPEKVILYAGSNHSKAFVGIAYQY